MRVPCDGFEGHQIASLKSQATYESPLFRRLALPALGRVSLLQPASGSTSYRSETRRGRHESRAKTLRQIVPQLFLQGCWRTDQDVLHLPAARVSCRGKLKG